MKHEYKVRRVNDEVVAKSLLKVINKEAFRIYNQRETNLKDVIDLANMVNSLAICSAKKDMSLLDEDEIIELSDSISNLLSQIIGKNKFTVNTSKELLEGDDDE